MSNVSADTANWRLFGGGGVAVGGLLLLIVVLIGFAGSLSLLSVSLWLTMLAYLALAAGFFLVAWGQTGSNGAVGALLWGKVALFVLAGGYLVMALVLLLGLGFGTSIPVIIVQIAQWAVVLGAVAAAVAIYQRGVAKGLAKFALLVVALLLVLQMIGQLADADFLSGAWMQLLFSLALLGTGVAYVFNGKFAK